MRLLDMVLWLVESVWMCIGLVVVVVLWLGIAVQYVPFCSFWKLCERLGICFGHELDQWVGWAEAGEAAGGGTGCIFEASRSRSART